MAEEMQKIYCCPQDNSSAMWAALMSGRNESPVETAALLNNNNFNNSPFAYLIWLMAMRYMGNGWENGGGAENYNSRQIAALQGSVNDNHNNDLVMQAMSNNQAAIRELAQTFNCNLNAIQGAVCNVRSAVESVGGAVGMSAERVINAANLGDLNIVQQLKDCCCNTQKSILTQGYENQLANQAQTQAITGQITDVRQALVNGFAQSGYATQAQTCDIINAINASQQKTNDLLTHHWADETALKLQDAKLELSQLRQNAYLVSELKTTT